MRLYHNLYIVLDNYIIFNIKNKLKKLSKICNTYIIIKQIPKEYIEIINDKILQKYLYLKNLTISYNFTITDSGIKHLNLSYLNANCSLITDDGIKNMTNLHILDIEKTIISDNGIKNLKLSGLRVNRKITDNGIKNMNLQTLIANKHITDEGIKNMNLYTLSASGSKITDNGILHMSNLKNLYTMFSNISNNLISLLKNKNINVYEYL